MSTFSFVFSFAGRDEYLAARLEWKTQYRALSQAQRDAKTSLKNAFRRRDVGAAMSAPRTKGCTRWRATRPRLEPCWPHWWRQKKRRNGSMWHAVTNGPSEYSKFFASCTRTVLGFRTNLHFLRK